MPEALQINELGELQVADGAAQPTSCPDPSCGCGGGTPASPCCKPGRACAPLSLVDPCGGAGEPDCALVLGMSMAMRQSARIYRETWGSGQPRVSSGTYSESREAWQWTGPGGLSPTRPPPGEVPDPLSCHRCMFAELPDRRWQNPDPVSLVEGVFDQPFFECGTTDGEAPLPGELCVGPIVGQEWDDPCQRDPFGYGRFSRPYRFPTPDPSVRDELWLVCGAGMGFSSIYPLQIQFGLRVRKWLDADSRLQLRAGFLTDRPCPQQPPGDQIRVEQMTRELRFDNLARSGSCWLGFDVSWLIDYAIVYEGLSPQPREEVRWSGSASIRMLHVAGCGPEPGGLAILPSIPGGGEAGDCSGCLQEGGL